MENLKVCILAVFLIFGFIIASESRNILVRFVFACGRNYFWSIQADQMVDSIHERSNSHLYIR